MPNEVLRLRPAERRPFLPGFVPVELVAEAALGSPAAAPSPFADRRPVEQDVEPPPVPDPNPSWADRDSLFGD